MSNVNPYAAPFLPGGYGAPNPMAAYQNNFQRPPGMDQAAPNFAPPVQSTHPAPSPQAFPALKIRAVSGLDEARAAPIDFDGSIYVFMDAGVSKIYVKRLGMDGIVTFQTFALQPDIAAQETVTATRADLETVLQAVNGNIDELRSRLNAMETKLTKGAAANAKSNASHGDAAK